MIKKLTALVVLVLIILVIPASASAARATTDVTGNVTNNGQPVKGAKVTVVCDNHAHKTTTNASGTYLVTYKLANCPDNTKATVVATKDGLGGVNSGTVNSVTTKLNVAIVNVSLPEFGLFTGGAATLAGAGAIFAIRRRQAAQS